MVRQSLTAVLALLAIAAIFVFLPTGQAVSQRIQEVFVTNFPDLQRIEGKVTVEGPVRLSTLETFRDLTVPPVHPSETTRLVEAGHLVADGFPSVVLSLHGVVKGHVARPGTVGVMLVPDQPTIQEAFEEQGQVHFALEAAAAGVTSKTPYFASNQPRYTVGFPSYRVLLYNTTDKAVEVNLFAYLTN